MSEDDVRGKSTAVMGLSPLEAQTAVQKILQLPEAFDPTILDIWVHFEAIGCLAKC